MKMNRRDFLKGAAVPVRWLQELLLRVLLLLLQLKKRQHLMKRHLNI